MTLEEMKASNKDILTPKDVSEVLHCAPYALNQTAAVYPNKIGFPFLFVGNRMKIPRIGFVNWFEAKNVQQESKRSAEE